MLEIVVEYHTMLVPLGNLAFSFNSLCISHIYSAFIVNFKTHLKAKLLVNIFESKISQWEARRKIRTAFIHVKGFYVSFIALHDLQFETFALT